MQGRVGGSPSLSSSSWVGIEPLEGRCHLSATSSHHHHHRSARAARRAAAAAASTPANVNVTRLSGNEMESQVAANPANPNNLVVVSQSDANGGSAIPVSRSFDGGRTWLTTYIGPLVDGYGATPRPDARAIFDAF